MKNPLQSLLEAGVIATGAFPQNSRYYGASTRTYTGPDGQSTTYVARRLVPQPDAFATVGQYAVKQGDRLDLVASRYLGDPLLFWRLCDANSAIAPDDLLDTPGRMIRITLPQGIPGTPNA